MNERDLRECECCHSEIQPCETHYLSCSAGKEAETFTLCTDCVAEYEVEKDATIDSDVLGFEQFEDLREWIRENEAEFEPDKGGSALAECFNELLSIHAHGEGLTQSQLYQSLRLLELSLTQYNALLSAAKAIRRDWEHNLTAAMEELNHALTLCGEEPEAEPDSSDAVTHGENCGCKSFDDCPERREEP